MTSHPKLPHVPTAVLVASMVLGLVGGAISVVTLDAAAVAAAALTKGDVKKIADKRIAKKAPGLSVDHANTADSATSATTAATATTATSAGNASQLGGVAAADYAKRGRGVVSLPNSGWRPSSSGDPASISHGFNGTSIFQGASGARNYVMPLTIPTATGGTLNTITKVRWCYTASVGAHLVFEGMNIYTFTTGDGTGPVSVVNNSVDLSNAGCRIINVNQVLNPDQATMLFVTFNWTGGASITLGAVTVEYQPSTTPVPAVN